MIVVPVGKFCTYDHAFMWQRDKQDAARDKQLKKASVAMRNEKKQHRAKKKTFYGNDKKTQLKLAQKAFNAFIRERDKDRDCISCGQYVRKSQRQAGHYRTFKGLRFNQSNCHLQCVHCNMYLSANIVEYRIRLVNKIGLGKVEWLESQNEPLKLSVQDIVSIKVYYTKLLKRMKEAYV